MIIDFVHLQVLGCSFGMAAKHVWYSRFTMEPGWSLLDLLLERMEPSAGSEQPNSDAGSSSTDDGICGMGASEDASGQIPVETCEMSGAIPALISTRTPSCIPNEELDDTDISDEEENIADAVLVPTLRLENANDGLPSINIPFLPGSTDLSIAGDVEAQTNATRARRASLTGANQYSDMHPGLGIDRAWRYTMAGFLVGPLPQAIKVFGMKGIMRTQIIVGVQIWSFVVPEVFRLIAVSVRAPYPRPMTPALFAIDDEGIGGENCFNPRQPHHLRQSLRMLVCHGPRTHRQVLGDCLDQCSPGLDKSIDRCTPRYIYTISYSREAAQADSC